MFYYWISTDSRGRDNSRFELIRGEIIDGEKDRTTEETLIRCSYEDVPGYQEAEQAGDLDQCDECINAYIKNELGFLPDYEVD